ncbi:MAG: hypothetical protein IKS90_00675 [Clostridia bacterium]|nr:hypothetical protein [Clostridia bacterium]
MKIYKKLFAALIAVCLLVSAFSGVSTAAADTRTLEGNEIPDGYVVVSFEAFVLGYGYIIEPTYVPYTEGESVADVTIRLLDEAGVEAVYSFGGFGFYLSGVASEKLANDTPINVPAHLAAELINNYCYDEEDGWSNPENGDGILSEMEFTYYSGWMYTDNNASAPVGASELKAESGHSYRWMYSIYGFGMDVGISDGFGMFPEFDNPAMGVDRDEAHALYAVCMDDIATNSLVSEGGACCDAFAEFEAIITDLASTQEDIDAAIAALEEALLAAVVPGDTDCDGNVDIADTIRAARHSLGIKLLRAVGAAAADYNGDGNIDITDVNLIARVSLGLPAND